MLSKSKTSLFVRIILVIVMLAGFSAIAPQSASAEAMYGKEAASSNQDCVPGSGWTWTPGPGLPDVAAQVQKKLSAKGIAAEVLANGYGETDSCGTYHPWGVDFTVQLSNTFNNQASQQNLADAVLPVLKEHGKPHLGNVKLFSAQGRDIPLDTTGTETALQSAAIAEGMDAGEPVTKKVYVIVYDPILGNGQRLSQRLGWSSHATITQQTVALFQQATGNRLNYQIAYTTVVPAWPQLVDGFIYTESQYLAVIANPSLHHEPTGVDYNKIVNDPQFDLCGKASRGEIDEVWVYNGPWFGFWESTLAGPGGFWYNSPAVPGPHNCNRLLPIMGPSPERSVNEAVHNFTHRSEATMSQVYGGWQQNNTSTSWNKFGLVKAQSPNYSYSGCGSSHYPPNATSGYSYTDPAIVPSNCDDFLNYPNLSDPITVAKPTSCTAWNCVELNYYSYWFGHFPSFPGCGPDNVANDWWKYLLSPGYALYPSLGCQATHMISGNVGTGNVTLSYTDGTAKTVTSDSSGNYFLIVSDNWSGTLTPSKTGFAFTPSSRSFSGVLGEQYNQDFTPQGTDPTKYYVNGVTGNNSNACITPAAPCRNIQEAINKASPGNTVYVTTGIYTFSTNGSPNVVIIDKNLTLSGGWNSDFTTQTGASTIDGSNRDNGILVISGTVAVENFIIQNSISQNSGAVYIVNGNFTLRRSTLRNNHAYSNGAGIFLDNGTLTVVNSTISGNVAGGSGGGIYASYNTGSSVTIQNSTIAYNQASSGGGISRTDGSFNIANSIVANNTASSGPDCQGTLTSASYNIIENISGCSIGSGIANLYVDPQTDPSLTSVMQVHMPLTGSPAVNAATLSGCPATDQLGTARPRGITCDIGSVEVLGDTVAPAVMSITRTSSNPTLNGLVDYRVTFSETVIGVDAGDFRLTTSGLAGSSIQVVSGSGSVYTVSVYTGSGSGTLRLDVVDNDSITDVFLNPLGGPGSGNGTFTGGEVYTVSSSQSLTVTSLAANDGWVLESTETSGIGGSLNTTSSTFDVGDDKSNRQYVGFLHFDTSGLPDNAVITSVTLKVRRQGVTGTDPFTTHGALLLDMQKPHFGTTAGLVVSDFQAAAGLASAASFGATPVESWYSATLSSSGYSFINLSGTTQLRLRFTRDDDNDRKADSVKFYSGEGTAVYRPQLVVQYYIP